MVRWRKNVSDARAFQDFPVLRRKKIKRPALLWGPAFSASQRFLDGGPDAQVPSESPTIEEKIRPDMVGRVKR